MKERLFAILQSLVGEDLLFVTVKAVDEFDEQVFELKIEHQMSPMFSEHRTFLRWETFSEGERASFGIEHLWGWLDTDIPDHQLIRQLIAALRENTRTWQASDHFIGLREYDGVHLLSLNSSGFILLKWPDEDIKVVLGQYITNLAGAFISYDPSLTSFRNNWAETRA